MNVKCAIETCEAEEEAAEEVAEEEEAGGSGGGDEEDGRRDHPARVRLRQTPRGRRRSAAAGGCRRSRPSQRLPVQLCCSRCRCPLRRRPRPQPPPAHEEKKKKEEC